MVTILKNVCKIVVMSYGTFPWICPIGTGSVSRNYPQGNAYSVSGQEVWTPAILPAYLLQVIQTVCPRVDGGVSTPCIKLLHERERERDRFSDGRKSCFVCNYANTLLKSDVTRRDHVVRCHRSQECGSRFVNFIRDGTVFA